MYRLRADVEDKLNRLPLRYVDGQPRGDLLSRVTNDIDNVAQSLQQTLSQLLTSSLTLVGVLDHDVHRSRRCWPWSPSLTVPAVDLHHEGHHQALEGAASSPSGATPASLNAQVEEAFTGHSLVKVFGRQADVEQRFNDKNEELFEASFGAQFISGIIQPAMMFFGNLNYVAIAVIGGLRVSSGQMTHRRRPGLHPVLAPVHPAAHPAGVDDQRACSRASPRPSGSSSCSTPPEEVADDDAVPLDDLEPPRPGRVRPRVVLLRPGQPAHRGPVARGRARPDRRHRRARPARARPRW